MSVETMSFAEMEKYQGTNPKPGDFETFWERGLAQAREAGASCELVPAKFQVPGAECFHLFFSGVDGARIHAKYLRPFKTTEKHPVIFMFHGYTGDSGDWWYMFSTVYSSAGSGSGAASLLPSMWRRIYKSMFL